MIHLLNLTCIQGYHHALIDKRKLWEVMKEGVKYLI
jgi:hypothetical protein